MRVPAQIKRPLRSSEFIVPGETVLLLDKPMPRSKQRSHVSRNANIDVGCLKNAVKVHAGQEGMMRSRLEIWFPDALRAKTKTKLLCYASHYTILSTIYIFREQNISTRYILDIQIHRTSEFQSCDQMKAFYLLLDSNQWKITYTLIKERWMAVTRRTMSREIISVTI